MRFEQHTTLIIYHVLIFIVVSSNSIRELVGEMFIMKNFDHPNVLSLLGACVDMNDDDMLKMILPFMSNGDLKNYLRTNRLDPTNTEQLTKVCIIGMEMT